MSAATASAATVIRCAGCGKANRVRPVARGIPRCAACKQPLPWLVEADEASFDAEVEASVPVLVDLWAPWCAPCHAMAPTLEQVARERAGRLKVVKADIEANPRLATRFGVQGIPLLVLLRGGEELGRLTGAAPAARLNAWLNSRLTLASSA